MGSPLLSDDNGSMLGCPRWTQKHCWSPWQQHGSTSAIKMKNVVSPGHCLIIITRQDISRTRVVVFRWRLWLKHFDLTHFSQLQLSYISEMSVPSGKIFCNTLSTGTFGTFILGFTVFGQIFIFWSFLGHIWSNLRPQLWLLLSIIKHMTHNDHLPPRMVSKLKCSVKLFWKFTGQRLQRQNSSQLTVFERRESHETQYGRITGDAWRP